MAIGPRITPFTQVPNRNVSRQALVDTTNAFFAEVPTFVTEANALADAIETDADLINGSIAAAELAETNAGNSAAAAADSETAAGISEDNAQTFAAAAQAAIGAPSLVGNAFKPLRVNSAEDGVEWANIVEYQEFLTSGTWTKPAGVTWVYVEVIGGGGSGAKSDSGFPTCGGGGGGYADKIFLATDVAGSVSVTIGAGGAARSGSGRLDGNPGGSSSFGAMVNAPGGGAGGQINSTDRGGDGGGGEAGTGDVGSGGYSSGGGGARVGGNCIKGGAGGGGPADSGGVSQQGGNGGAGGREAPATAGTVPGGAGGACLSATSGHTSGAGAAGRVRVWAW